MTFAPRSLRGQLLVACLAVGLLPASALSGVVAWSALRAARQSTLDHSGQLAAAVAAEIGQHLDAQLLHLRAVRVAVERRASPAAVAELPLAQYVLPNHDIQLLLLLDADAHVVAAEPPVPDLLGNDLSRLPFVAAARALRDPVWSSATPSPRTGTPVVALVLPGDPWTLVEFLDLATVREVVSRVRSQRRTDVTVIDRDGTILAADDERLVQERVNVGDLPLVQEALSGRAGTAELDLLGQSQLASASPVPATGWVVVAAQPLDQAYALLARIQHWVLAAFALAAALAGATAVYLSRRIQRPIEALASAAQTVAGGDYQLALPRGALRETDALAASFDAMVAAIRERERARDEADRHYRTVVSTSLVAVMRTSPQGDVIFSNDAAARLVGLPSGRAATGRALPELLLDRAEWDRLIGVLHRGGRIVNQELMLRRVDGSPVEVLANATAGEEGLTLVMLDVTEEHRVAAELARLEDQLRHAQRLDALGRLAGGVAHDFNNLLTIIVGFAAEVQELLGPESPAREAVDGILQAAGRASRLTQSLLAYGRKQVLNPRELDLRELVREATQMAGRLIREDVAVAVVVPPDPVPVLADPGQLEQVLMNLCTNARDAMPVGGRLTVTLSTESLAEDLARDWGLRRGGRYARIEVRDTGQGMGPEVRAHIFEPFFTTKERGKGTGLGLAIAYGIVRQHEGHVQVRSAPGAGTSVTVFLPLQRALRAAPAATVAVAPAAEPTGQETILLAEDELLVRRVMRSVLERGGYRVLEAADGAEAVEVFAHHREGVALCVFDVVMPGLNGREARERVRQLRPGIPVLLVSGYAADVLDSAGPGEDVPELLGKPVVPRELLAKVRELLDRAAEAGRRAAAG